MDSKSITTRSELKSMLCDEKAEPKALSLRLLEEITYGFSEDQEIGRGGFAVVYKGILDNGETVAVKRLSDSYMYYEEQFHREIECLIKVRHKNVIRFIGYCANSEGKAESYNGKFVMADERQRLLCFEYLTHGTLDKYITDASSGLDWGTRFNIINGICNGLHYLHQNQIVHLDLKPPNILLDGNMLPKIADFGLSRCFAEKQSRAITTKIGVTMGYSTPELFSREITYRSDLYSLGVIIIEILTGKNGYEAVEDVLKNWSNRLEKSHKDIQIEQIRVCLVIGTQCTEYNPAKRPNSMKEIMSRLHEAGNTEGSVKTAVTRSSAKIDYDGLHDCGSGAPGGTGLETTCVSEPVDDGLSMAISATSPDQLRRISTPEGLGETSTEVLESWSNRSEQSNMDIQLQQVQVCTDIEMECIESNPAKRPVSKQHIIAKLEETGNTEASTRTVMASSSALQDSSFSGSSIFVSDRTMPEHTPVAVFIAVTKIRSLLADEAFKHIIAKLSQKVTNLKELPLKIEQIRKQLTVMSNVITQIGMVSLRDEVFRSWIGEVRSVAYLVEDVMDKYSYYVLQIKQEGFLKKLFIKGTHYAKVFTEITDEVVQVEKEIELVIQMKDQWLQPSQLVANPLTEMERQRSKDSFPGLLKEEDLVGIEENRALLTEWLYSEELDNPVITVSGMGGLGKSTLVSDVYEREKINFPAHAWIVVSQVYTVDALLRKLLWKIGYTEQPLSAGIDKMDVHDLKKEIHQRIGNRKYLIVLDDVWEQEVYFQMYDALQNLQGSRIVITTRMGHVAAISPPTRHLELLPLGNPDAFDLFCRRAFYNRKGHICPKDLEAIAISIVDRCHGLPLAIITIGRLLSSRPPRLDFWKQAYNHIQSEWSNDGRVSSVLNLSYHDLPAELQICFLYCTLLPEDHPMSRESLVRLWVAEGFVMSNEKNIAEEVAERYLMELIHRNMLEVLERDELGRVHTYKMHSIVRELAISIAKEERFASANDYGTIIQMGKNVRRLSSCGWKDNTALKLNLPHLRTVVALGVISPSRGMLSSILAESNYLTVLVLEDSEVTEVPTSIGSLFNLRYIGLRRTRVKSLPDSIENLCHLHTLDIKQTKIEKLPRGLFKIKKLRHLLADRYADEKQTEFRYFIGVQAPKELSNLEELQTLETVESSIDLAEQLKKLMQLRSLWIHNISAADCTNLFATLSTMPLLSCLLLFARDENETLSFKTLNPRSTDLHRLIIRGQWAKGTLNCPIFLSHGKNLKYLALSWCRLAEDPLGMLAPSMPNLTYLRLSNMHSSNTLVLHADSFPNLKTLVLKNMHDVSQLNILDGALPSIECLFVVSLLNLDKIPQGIESLHSLKKLWLLGLHEDFRSQWLNSGMRQKIQHVPEVRV